MKEFGPGTDSHLSELSLSESPQLAVEGQELLKASAGSRLLQAVPGLDTGLNKIFPAVVIGNAIRQTAIDGFDLVSNTHPAQRSDLLDNFRDHGLGAAGSLLGAAIYARVGLPKYIAVALGYELGDNGYALARSGVGAYKWLTSSEKR